MRLRPRMIVAASALAAISLLLADSASAEKAAHRGNHHGMTGASTRNMDPDRYGGPGWSRPDYAWGAGAALGGALAAPQPGYGYADYGYDYGPGSYGYDPGYAPGYGYPYGSAYPQSCTYVGGPKSGMWSC